MSPEKTAFLPFAQKAFEASLTAKKEARCGHPAHNTGGRTGKLGVGGWESGVGSRESEADDEETLGDKNIYNAFSALSAVFSPAI